MKTKLLLAFVIIFQQVAFSSPIEDGKSLFMSKCSGCHNVNKQLVGPPLAGLDQRRTIEWITKFVNSSQSMVKQGDSAAVALFSKFNNVIMPDHPDLTSADIKGIVEFIKSEAKPISESVAPFSKPIRQSTEYKPLSLQKNGGIFISFFFLLAALIGSLIFGVRVNELNRGRQEVIAE
jgi:cytochrome c551/c552